MSATVQLRLMFMEFTRQVLAENPALKNQQLSPEEARELARSGILVLPVPDRATGDMHY
ncbi:MAG: hypothetical protein H6674_11105, partial [Dehalococcoidia bacterium]|nr:hypothetical protein [Dehalococcoidia bacterium]